jgi:hypothetical protein
MFYAGRAFAKYTPQSVEFEEWTLDYAILIRDSMFLPS